MRARLQLNVNCLIKRHTLELYDKEIKCKTCEALLRARLALMKQKYKKGETINGCTIW